MKQKAKCEWLTQADKATKFFHANIAKGNHANSLRNFINYSGSNPITDVQLCEEIVRCFERPYNIGIQNTIFPEIICRHQVSDYGKLFLNESISMEEVKDAVFSTGVDRAPGPYEFKLKKVKTHWEKLRENKVLHS